MKELSIRANKTILPIFIKKHFTYYKHDMAILHLKPMDCNRSKDACYRAHFLKRCGKETCNAIKI